MVHHFPAPSQVRWIPGYEESNFLVVLSLWVDGWRWPSLASHLCVWFISGVRSSHLVAAPTLADKRQTTISPLVSVRAHQQITLGWRVGGLSWAANIKLLGHFIMCGIKDPFLFYLGLLSKDWQSRSRSALSAVQWCQRGDCSHDRDTEQTRSRPRARSTIRLVASHPMPRHWCTVDSGK